MGITQILLTIHGCHDDVWLQSSIRVVFAGLFAGPAFVAALALGFAWDALGMNGVAHLVERLIECTDEVLGLESRFIFFFFHC
jgi:hypothetical protein